MSRMAFVFRMGAALMLGLFLVFTCFSGSFLIFNDFLSANKNSLHPPDEKKLFHKSLWFDPAFSQENCFSRSTVFSINFAHAALLSEQTKEEGASCPAWNIIVTGLEFGHAPMADGGLGGDSAGIILLRIDPAKFNFVLRMATEEGASFSLREWSERHNLYAGINASMFLPDNLTSTGYMRSGSHINNPRAGGRLGAFFVSNPQKKGLPLADILEHDTVNWREVMEQYALVVQNFRLINKQGKILWSESGPAHSIAAVAKDGSGSILFILSQAAMTPAAFAQYIQKLPLDLTSVMYVEGGSHAGLFLREPHALRQSRLPGAVSYPVTGGMLHIWKGHQSLLNTRSNPEAHLPNILGIKSVE